MTDVNDVVLTLTLAAVDTTAPALTAFNARLLEQQKILDATSAKTAAASKATATQTDLLSAKYIAAQDKETAAAIKSADAQIAASQRVTIAVMRDLDKQTAAAKAAAEKRGATLNRGIGGGVLLGAGILAASVDESVKLDDIMQKLQGNTGSTAAQMKVFEDQVLSLGAKGPAAIDDIAQAFRHVSDLGYRNADAMTVVTEAWKGAIATGGKVEDVANALATILGNQHAPASMAAHDIDVIVTAAQQGNLTIPDFANNFSKIGTIAGSIHQPLEQVAAAFSTVSRATADPALAQTYMQGMLQHIIAPTGPAIKIMKELAQTVHIDLMPVFAQFTNGTITLHDLLVKVKEATGGSASEIFKLLGGIRGGQAGLILLNNHWQDYNKILGLTETANKNVDSSFNQMQKTAGAQLKTLENQTKELAISIGNQLLPALTGITQDISPVVKGLRDLNDQTGGGVTETIKLGIEWGAAALVLGKLIPWVLSAKDAFYGLAAGETAAAAANPAVWLTAAGVAVIAIGKDSVEASGKMKDSWDKVRNSYAEGNITLEQAEQRMRDLHLRVEQSTAAELNAVRAEDQHTDAVKRRITGEQNLINLLSERQKREAAIHPASSSPAARGPTLDASIAGYDLSKVISDATAKMNLAASQVAYDRNVLHITVQSHIDALNGDRAVVTALTKEQYDLTNGAKYHKTALKAATDGLDPFTRALNKARDAETEAQNAYAYDAAFRGGATKADIKNLADTTATYKRLQGQLDIATGAAQTREQKLEAIQDRHEKHAADLEARQDKAEQRLRDKQEALADAAEKAYKELLKLAHTSELVGPIQEASKARYAAMQGADVSRPEPTNYKSYGAYETAAAAYDKKHSEDFYHNNPSAVSSLIGRPGEMKIEGITPAQLLADPAVKKYLETLTEAKLKALGFTPGQLATIPGTTEWQKKQPIDTTVVTQLPGARFGQIGQSAPGVPSIGPGLAGGFLATAPGIIAGGQKLANTFEQQVQAGLDQIKTSKEVEKVTLEVAKRSGDTATVFSILDKQYLDGKATLAQVDQAYKENQGTVLASTRRQIDYDKSIGDTGDELAKTLELYHQGNATLAESVQAYNDNAEAVRKTTAQDLAFLESTGQWSAAMSSISTSLTGPLGDATAKLTYDFLTHTGNIEADTQAVKDHQAALDALTQATWDAQFTAANPAQQSQMLNTLAQPMISQQSSAVSAAQAMNTAQLGVIAAENALEVQGINAMTTQLADMGGIIKASSAVQTAQFSGQLAALNDLIPIQNDMAAIQKATSPQMLQTAQEQLKIDRLTAAMDQSKAGSDVKIAQMELTLAQDKMMVDMANADAQRVISMDNLTLAGDALNVQIASAKLAGDSLVVQQGMYSQLGGVQDYLSMIDGDLQNLTDAQNQQMSDQGVLAGDTGYANMVAASGAAMLGGDQLGIDSATAAATAANQAYQLQIAQYKVEQNTQQNTQQLVANQKQDNASLLSELQTMRNLFAFANSPASRRPLHGVGNVSTAQLINGWAATAAATQAA